VSTKRREIDDSSTALLAHVRNDNASETNRTHQINFEAIPPFLVGRVQGMTEPPIPRVIDQNHRYDQAP
jgi:hypothetical protein